MPWVSAELQRGRGVVGREIHQHRAGERVAGDVRDRLLRRRGAALRASRRGGRPPLRPRPERARRRVLRPWGSNTKPERSITPATRSASRRPPHARPMQRGQRAPDLTEPEQDDLHPLGLDHRAARDPRELKGGVDPPLRLGGLRRRSTTTEMLSSDEPCAMATTLIRRRGQRARRHRRRSPACRACRVRPRRSSPCRGAPRRRRSRPARSPRANSRSRLSRASSASGLGHAEADRVLGGRLRDEGDRDLPRRAARRRCAPRSPARRACRCP